MRASLSRPGGSGAQQEASSPPPRGESLPELRQTLRRQERLLADRKFLSRLPDKGKKISAFAEKLKVAITQEEERGRRMVVLSTGRLKFQRRQEGLDSYQCGIVANEDKSAYEEDSPPTPASRVNETLVSAVQNQTSIWATETRAKNELEPAEQASGKDSVSQASAASRFPHHDPHGSVGGRCEALVEALERTSVRGREDQEASEKGPDAECRENPSLGHPLRTPHCTEVLETRAESPVGEKSTFKPNRIPAKVSGSSRSSSEAPSPRGGHSPISAEERRRREKRHLDDITAARLPVLHHAPVQLLPLEESIALQIQQKAVYEEMQAKLAAQKLAQKLGIKMVAYEPEGDMGVRYREAKDEEGYSSADD